VLLISYHYLEDTWLEYNLEFKLRGYLPSDVSLLLGVTSETDPGLFLTVREHRKHYFRQTWVDYETLLPQQLVISPPAHLMGLWRKDYQDMATMIYGDYPDLAEVLEKVTHFLLV
jgi:hypothetical protein